MNFKFIYLFLIYSSTLISQESNVDFIHNKLDSGYFYMDRDVFKSEQSYKEALDSSLESKNDSLTAKTYVHLGILMRKKGLYADALEFHQKSLAIHLSQNDSIYIAADYHNIGATFRYLKDFDQAEKYILMAISIRENGSDSLNLAISYSQLGIVYRKIKDLDKALLYNHKALLIHKNIGDIPNIIHTKGNLAAIFYSKKDYLKSISLNLEALAYYENTNQIELIATRCGNLAMSYKKLKEYNTALKYLDRAIKISTKEQHLAKLRLYYKKRSSIHKKLSNYKSALDDYKKYKKYYDTIINLDNAKQIERTIAKVELNQQKTLDSLNYKLKEDELVYKKELAEKETNKYLLLIIGLLIGLMFLYYNNKKTKITATLKLKNKRIESDLLRKNLKISELEKSQLLNKNLIKEDYARFLLDRVSELAKANNNQTNITKHLNSMSQELKRHIQSDTRINVFKDTSSIKSPLNLENILIDQFPSITKAERQICLYIYAKLTTKEIIDVKGVTESSIKSMRYRIRKKMNVAKGEELEKVISKLFR